MSRYSAILVAVCLACAPMASAGAKIVISELLWSGSDLSSADEWIELTNIGSGTISLSGWTLTKISGGLEEEMLMLPANAAVGSSGFFLIANNDESSSRLSREPDLVDASVSLANTQLLIRLYDQSGSLVDAADDGVGAPFAGLNGATKASMERIDLSGSGQMKTNWQTAFTFWNFDDGAPLFGTPKAQNGTGPSIDTFPPREATNFAAEIAAETSTGSVGARHSVPLQISWTPSTSLDLESQTLRWNGTGITLSKSATGLTLSGIGTGVTFTLRSTDVLGNTSTGITTVSREFPNVKITEVLANPAGNDDEEWIEIGNLGKEAVDVSGWILDEGNSSGDFRIPSPFILLPLEHRMFPKSQTNLPLTNDGEMLSVKRGSTVMDVWSYIETAEEVSYGRRTDDSSFFQAFCVPTPNKQNDIILPEPIITIQKGSLSGERSVSVNLIAEVLTGSTAHASCEWNYGDGFTSASCNPPSHTFEKEGTYEIRLTYRDFCGNQIDRNVTASVTAPSDSSKKSSGQGGGTQGGGGESGNRTSCTPTNFEGVRISEFIPDPTEKDEVGEWIELENMMEENVSLCGWELDDADGGSKPFILDTFVMPPKEFLLLERSVTKIALNNSDDSARLFKPGGDLIEEISYGKSEEGESYALRSDGIFVWTPFLTPGSSNRFREVTRRSEDETVIVSAVLPNPDGTDEGNEWIELTNVGASSIDLTGWSLSNRKGKSYEIKNVLLAPGETRRFGSNLTEITLTNTEDDARLMDSQGNIVSFLNWLDAISGRIYRPSVAGKKVTARVISVIDGDTIDVDINGKKERVRMIGIDTPETVHPKKAVEKFGIQASDFTKKMLTGKTVILEFGDEERDKYDRLLAYVILDGVNFNGELIRRGFAYAYLRFPFSLSSLFSIYEEEARKAKIGLWADPEAEAFVLETKEDVEEEKIQERAMTGSGSTASGSTLSGSTLLAAEDELVGARHALPLRDNPFSEIMSNPPKEGHLHDLGEYIELWNPTDDVVTLESWILDDNPEGSSKPKKLSDVYIIRPQSYILLCKGEECDLPLSISLNNDGEELSLTSPDGLLRFSVTYPEMDRGEAYAFKDGWCHSTMATPDKENFCSTTIEASKKDDTACRGKACLAPTKMPKLSTDPLPGLRTKYRNIIAEEPSGELKKALHPLLAEINESHSSSMRDVSAPFSDFLMRLITLGTIFILSVLLTAFARRKAAFSTLVKPLNFRYNNGIS